MSGDVTLRGNGKPLRLRAELGERQHRYHERGGKVDVVTVSGDARVDIIDATEVRGRTTSGSLDLRAKLTRDGRVDVEGVSGEITLRLSAPGGFSTETESFSGDITAASPATSSVSAIRTRACASICARSKMRRECAPRRCRATSTSAIVDLGLIADAHPPIRAADLATMSAACVGPQMGFHGLRCDPRPRHHRRAADRLARRSESIQAADRSRGA